jgi:hypothetical protein
MGNVIIVRPVPGESREKFLLLKIISILMLENVS